MNPEKFVACIAKEKEAMLSMHFDPVSGSVIGRQIAKLNLTDGQLEELRMILDNSLSEAFYVILLGLDGAIPLGGIRANYELRAEDGTLLTGGALQPAASKQFH